MQIHDQGGPPPKAEDYDVYDGLMALPPGMSPTSVLRLKSYNYVQRKISLAAPRALKAVIDIMDNSDEDSLRLKAAESILDRFLGKAAQSVTVEHREPRPIVFSEKLQKLRDEAMRAVDAQATEATS